jgi:V/A-type H+-transporting ATPase subunit F
MYKIAVLGDRDSVLGFKALGLDVFPAESAEEARTTLHTLATGDYAIVYLTEQLAAEMMADVAKYKDSVTPAIISSPVRPARWASACPASRARWSARSAPTFCKAAISSNYPKEGM